MAQQRFEVVEDDSPLEFSQAAPPAKPEQRSDLATDLGLKTLALGLKTLSQRTIAAIADLFFLVTVGSAFWLWYLTPEPSEKQIVSLTIYAAFVLVANWLVRRK